MIEVGKDKCKASVFGRIRDTVYEATITIDKTPSSIKVKGKYSKVNIDGCGSNSVTFDFSVKQGAEYRIIEQHLELNRKRDRKQLKNEAFWENPENAELKK